VILEVKLSGSEPTIIRRSALVQQLSVTAAESKTKLLLLCMYLCKKDPLLHGTCLVPGSSQGAVKNILIEGDIGGKFDLATVFNGFK